MWTVNNDLSIHVPRPTPEMQFIRLANSQLLDIGIQFTAAKGLLVGHDSSVGIATRYGLDAPGIESRRPQWPSGLSRGSAAAGIAGLNPGGAWMCVW